MIRIIVEYDKDDEAKTANDFGRFLYNCTQVDGTGWTEFKDYLKELFVRKNAEYSDAIVISRENNSAYYTEQEVSDMGILGDNFREYLYGWNDAVVPGKGFLKRYVDMYLTHIGR